MPISKVESDGDIRYVYGLATDQTVDSDEQIVDPDFARKAMAEWFGTFANVRQMHSTNIPPAGKGVTLESGPLGEMVKAKVVEAGAVKLVDERVYNGFSVGIARPRIIRDPRAKGGRIVDGKIVEISLVDRPANFNAKFAVVKAAGADGHAEYVGKVVTLDGGEVARAARRVIDPPKQITRFRRGDRVTVHARDERDQLKAYVGKVVHAGLGSVELDTTGFETVGRRVRLLDIDSAAAFKGVVPLGNKIATHVVAKAARDTNGYDRRGRNGSRVGQSADGNASASVGRPQDAEHSSDAERPGDEPRSTEDSVAEKNKKAFPGAAKPFGSKEPKEGSPAEGSPAEEAAETPAEEAAEKGGSFPGAAPQFGADKAHEVGHADGCDGEFGSDGKCGKCGGMKAAEKGADLSSVLEDVNAVKEDIKDVENDLEDVTGQSADGKDDGKDGGDEADGGADDGGDSSEDDAPDDGGDADKAAKASKKLAIVGVEGGWKVTKGAEVLGTHSSRSAAEAHLGEIKRERKAAKVAKKAAKQAAAKIVKTAEDDDTIPWLVRRLHDFTCAAYKTEDVFEAYPAIEKSITAALGPESRQALFVALAEAVREDAGAGTGTSGIASISKAMQALEDLITVEGAPEVGTLTLAARAEIHDAFKIDNAAVLGAGADPIAGLPKPSESITPGQFKRPYIQAGHQRGVAQQSQTHIPETTHPVSASDFGRGPLTEGHQRYLTSKLEAVHDGLADWRPELCRMRAMTAEGDFAPLRQPASPMTQTISNGASNGPVPVTLTMNVPTATSFTGVTSQFAANPVAAPVAKMLTAEDIAALLAEAVRPFAQKMSTLEKAIGALESAPDPAASPRRGSLRPSLGKAASLSVPEAQQQAARDKRQEKIDFLSGIARSGSPEQAIEARERLARKYGIETVD